MPRTDRTPLFKRFAQHFPINRNAHQQRSEVPAAEASRKDTDALHQHCQTLLTECGAPAEAVEHAFVQLDAGDMTPLTDLTAKALSACAARSRETSSLAENHALYTQRTLPLRKMCGALEEAGLAAFFNEVSSQLQEQSGNDLFNHLSLAELHEKNLAQQEQVLQRTQMTREERVTALATFAAWESMSTMVERHGMSTLYQHMNSKTFQKSTWQCDNMVEKMSHNPNIQAVSRLNSMEDFRTLVAPSSERMSVRIARQAALMPTAKSPRRSAKSAPARTPPTSERVL